MSKTKHIVIVFLDDQIEPVEFPTRKKAEEFFDEICDKFPEAKLILCKKIMENLVEKDFPKYFSNNV